MTTLREADQQALEVLRVTPDGEFIWHTDSDRLIEEGDFTNSPAMPHILRVLRRVEKLERQRDALLEALKQIDKEFRAHGRQHWPEAVKARAAIKAAEENT